MATVYFTFKYLWNGNNKLKTETKSKTNTYETIISDNGNDLDEFFAKLNFILTINPDEPSEKREGNRQSRGWFPKAEKRAEEES